MNDIVPVAREVTLEEVREESRRHREECEECSFIDEEAHIRCTDQDFALARKRPVFIGCFTMQGWSGHNRFYLTRCEFGDCPRHQEASRGFFADYPHGYTDGGRLYLRCPSCQGRQVLDEPSVYWAIGMPSPPSAWEGFTDLLRMIRGKSAKHGDGHRPPDGWEPPTR